jgi:ketosteroid isomerase-like protein
MLKLPAAMVVLVLLVAPALYANNESEAITQDELVRRTQDLLDAVAMGDKSPFQKYYADDAMYFDEKGRAMDKAALLADVAPLPKGYSGNIKLVKAQSRIQGHTAILTYDLDEKETIFGQALTARYHGTDTWLYRDGRWQIGAGQMLRYYEDPAPGRADIVRFNEYVRTYELAPGITRTVSRERRHVVFEA